MTQTNAAAAGQNKNTMQMTLSKLSHEIRNPLTLINSELQLIEISHPEVCSCPQWEDVMDNLEYIKELLDQLSDYSNAGRLSLSSVDPGEFLNSVLSCEKRVLNYLGIQLDTEIPDTLPPILLDRVKMRQALLNLLRNARESISGPQGSISVQMKPEPSGISIFIRDNGCGMTLEQQQKIFHPFTTFKDGGTGLGLSITKQIIQAHGGNIKVSSTPGIGTIFHIFLG